MERNRRKTWPPPTIDEYRIYCTPSIQNRWRTEKKANAGVNPGLGRPIRGLGPFEVDGSADLSPVGGECNNGVFKAGKTNAVPPGHSAAGRRGPSSSVLRRGEPGAMPVAVTTLDGISGRRRYGASAVGPSTGRRRAIGKTFSVGEDQPSVRRGRAAV